MDKPIRLGCGRGCYNLHQFKKYISIAAEGDLDKLLITYKKNIEVWKEDNCNCTKTTHQAIFENALGRPFKVDILETIRRGRLTCHFLVHV